jgi:hypothetical protein
MGVACSTYGERSGVYRVLVGKPEEKRPLGKPRRRWKDDIKTYLQEMEWDASTGLIWFRIATGDGHFKCGIECSGSHKMREISRLAEKQSTSQEGLFSMK